MDITQLEVPEDETMGERNDIEDTCTLSLYNILPEGNFPLEIFYECTNQRYKLLRLLADIGDCETASQENWIPALLNKLLSEDLGKFYDIIVNNFTDEKENELLKEWDSVSHFALRTASARLFESLKWFIKQEVKLFYLRWSLLSSNKQKHFLKTNNLTLNHVSVEELLFLQDKFCDSSLTQELFKTKFQRASRLMKTRTVYIFHGWVYFTLGQAVYPLTTLYEEALNKSLRRAKAKYDYLDFDSRYSFFFRRISDEIKLSLYRYTSLSKSKIDLKDLNSLSVTSFPLCMSILHHTLLKDSHLRNGGRFQYNLFLKGIGITLYDAIKFWRDIFTKRMTLDCFTRHYLYSIRHNYGMLGKQADYPPLNCAKIMDFSPGPLDRHGCPFERSESEYLFYHLKRCGLTQEECQDVLCLVENNLPQQACARVFEIKHGVTEQGATSHPNIYFQSSQKLINKINNIKTNDVQGSHKSQSPTSDNTVSSEYASKSPSSKELCNGNNPMSDLKESKQIASSIINDILEKYCSKPNHSTFSEKISESVQHLKQCKENLEPISLVTSGSNTLNTRSQNLAQANEISQKCSDCCQTSQSNHVPCKKLDW